MGKLDLEGNPLDLTVYISGETGTGKELAARILPKRGSSGIRVKLRLKSVMMGHCEDKFPKEI